MKRETTDWADERCPFCKRHNRDCGCVQAMQKNRKAEQVVDAYNRVRRSLLAGCGMGTIQDILENRKV